MPEQTIDSQDGTPAEIPLRIEGMTCASCVARVESALRGVEGVRDARVNLATGKATVAAGAGADADALVKAVERAGYGATRTAGGETSSDPVERQSESMAAHRQALVWALAIGIPVMLLHWVGHSFGGHAAHRVAMILQAVLTIALLASPAGRPILAGGWRATIHRSPNMDLLIALGVLAATMGSVVGLFVARLSGMNYFHDAAMILGFISLGRYLEARARGRASASLSALIRRSPRQAVRLENGVPVPVAVDAVRPGDVLQVGAESYVPVDGEVLTGRASVDQSMWTGESEPVEVEPGDAVLGGTYVHAGAMTVRATAVGAKSAIARIVTLVEEAQSRKTGMQRLADRVAGVFVPIVVVIALLTAGGWLLFGGVDAGGQAFSAMIAVLVVACPCAMGLATPAAVLVATGNAALRGILVRDPAVFERAGAADTILLDKTGTLTRGRPHVAEIAATDGMAPDQLLQLAASAEQFSPHPLAKAIVDRARGEGVTLLDPESYAAEAGLGVRAGLNGKSVVVGSERFLTRSGIAVPDGNGAAGAGRAGTLVHVARDGAYLGALVLQDEIRSGAAEAVRSLKSLGIRPMVVTGDRAGVAEAVARAAGIEEVRAGVSPVGKAELITSLQKDGRRVIMVGDGVNDAPALAAADIGIAMAGGTEVAAETAPISLIGDRLELVPAAVDLARRSLRVIRQNLFWAFAYNVVAIPLAAMGILPAGYAAAAMMMSSLTVVLNSLRLQRG